MKRIDKRITALSFHIKTSYWLYFTPLNNIPRYKTEKYYHTAVKKSNRKQIKIGCLNSCHFEQGI